MDSRFDYLFQRYFDKKSTPKEEQELLERIRQAESDDRLKELMDQAWNRVSPEHVLSREQSDRILSDIHAAVSGGAGKIAHSRTRRVYYWRWAAACLLVLCAAGWLWYRNNDAVKRPPEITGQNSPSTLPPVAVTKARLILGNGSSIMLDSTANKMLARQGAGHIQKQDNQLSYTNEEKKQEKTVYNTIITPKGGQYRILLADGSKVWLNAASSLRFPTSLSSEAKERRVTLTGEAYFEVKTNPDQPFIVSTSGMEVKVLGTHFDIKAYADEPAVRTTLLNGAVVVSKGGKNTRLKPGEQAVTKPDKTADIRVKSADAQSALAWKNGLFVFHNTAIEPVLREIARWYDTEVIYQEKVNARLSGVIPRNSDLKEVLHMLEVTSDIHFEVKGTKIFVRSKA